MASSPDRETIEVSFTLNGEPYTVTVPPGMRMLDVIRDELGLTGTKEGCGVGECGACTVVLNGNAVTSCLVLAGQMQDAEILTIEGMSEDAIGSVIQRCFVDGDAVQCGFCTPGFVMSAYALLKKNPEATREEIRQAVAGNICRCTGYIPIVNAIEKAAEELRNQ
ncbi:MAG: (2Fe-2S)-binding protein [Saccharofermentanales bacterium]